MSGDDDNSESGWIQYLLASALAIFINGIFVVLGIVGMLVVHALFRAWQTGEAGTGEAIAFGFFGLLLSVIGFGFLYVTYVGAPRFLSRIERKRQKYQDRPWLIDRQWRARRVVHSTKYTAWFMWLWCLVWWGILGFLWSVNKDLIMIELKGTWGQAIPASIPFVAGIIGLLVALSLTWSRWRYGDAVLLIKTLPGYLGDRFRGKVQARLSGPLNEPVGLTLSCGRLTSKRARSTDGGSETIWVTTDLWADQHQLRPAQTTFSRGVVTIPIDFDLPVDQPESGHILDDPQIVWKLAISPGTVLDRPVQCEFQIPVFARRRDTSA